jgi:hypothetical protein
MAQPITTALLGPDSSMKSEFEIQKKIIYAMEI